MTPNYDAFQRYKRERELRWQQAGIDVTRDPYGNPLWQLRERSARLRLHRALWHLFLTFGVCTFALGALGALVATAIWRLL